MHKFPRKTVFKPAGGKYEVNKVAKDISEGKLDLFAAVDSEYSRILNTSIKSNRVIHSYGHSIENSFLCPTIIYRIIASHSAHSSELFLETKSWFKNSLNVFRKLLFWDITSINESLGIDVLPKSSARFLLNQAIDNQKVREYETELEEVFESLNFSKLETVFCEANQDIRFILPGHFMVNCILEYCRKTIVRLGGRLSTFPIASFYSQCISLLEVKCGNCKETAFYKEKIEQISSYA